MRVELFRRDDGWTRRVVRHDDGRLDCPDGLPDHVPFEVNDYTSAVLALQGAGYSLVIE